MRVAADELVLEDEKERLYHEWRASTEQYWELIFGPANSIEAARPIIEEMDRTLDALMKAHGHSRSRRI